MKKMTQSKLILKDGSVYEGKSFGAEKNITGEVVFATGMTGYVESLTDPSYRGQILVMTYPLIGNYGVQDQSTWESEKIQVSGLVVCNYNSTPSHYDSKMTLSDWLKAQDVPALEIKDTRGLVLKLREKGCILGSLRNTDGAYGYTERDRAHNAGSVYSYKSVLRKDFEDPNLRNLAAEVCVKKPKITGHGSKTVLLIDCGVKQNIVRELVSRRVKVLQVPCDYDPFSSAIKFDGVLISNGPGNPKMCMATIKTVRKIITKKIPTFGICLGNQILALAAGGDTAKMKFGHRGQNQPVRLVGSEKNYLTTQNHGFHVKKIPKGFMPWFVNLNDGTNEGIIHKKLPFCSVQFHPESCPGPMDTGWLFDYFLQTLIGR